MASQTKLINSSIMSYFQPQRANSGKNESMTKSGISSKSLPRSPSSRKISRKSLKPLQPTAERTGLTGRANKGGVKKRKHTEDTDADSDCKRQPSKVQRIVPTNRTVTVYKDPALAEDDKENATEPRDCKKKAEGKTPLENKPEATAEGRLEEVKDEDKSEVAIESTSATKGECSCNCHPKTEEVAEKPKEKTAEEEALELMGQEEITPAYWEQLAERRREALADALKENEELHQEVAELKEENGKLSELANQAEYFANMLKLVTGDEAAEDEGDGGGKDEIKEGDSGLECSLLGHGDSSKADHTQQHQQREKDEEEEDAEAVDDKDSDDKDSNDGEDSDDESDRESL